MPRKLKFPTPKDYAVKDAVILCSAQRVLDLYNQNTGETAARIAKTVKSWFMAQALKRGWAACHFTREVQVSQSGGCFLLNPASLKEIDGKKSVRLRGENFHYTDIIAGRHLADIKARKAIQKTAVVAGTVLPQ